MPKRKRVKTANPTAADLPQNPEFQAFADFTRRLMAVPKSDVGGRERRHEDDAETHGRNEDEDGDHAAV